MKPFRLPHKSILLIPGAQMFAPGCHFAELREAGGSMFALRLPLESRPLNLLNFEECPYWCSRSRQMSMTTSVHEAEAADTGATLSTSCGIVILGPSSR